MSHLDASAKTAEIEEAATRLANALHGSDFTTIQTTLGRVKSMAYPSPTAEEAHAESRVLDALAAQRAVALFRTEARLYSEEASRSEKVIQKLQQSAMWLDNQDFTSNVIEPPKEGYERQLELAKQAEITAVQKEHDFVKLRREAHAAVACLMWREEAQYREEFQKALAANNGAQAAEQVYDILAGFEQACSQQDLHPKQPVPQGLELSTPEYLAWLRKVAQDQISDTNDDALNFTSLVTSLADKCNGVATVAPLKGYARTVQKVQEKYKGDYSKVLDLVRGMVVFETISDLKDSLELLKQYNQDGVVQVVRAKDRLSAHFDAEQHAGGYRDVLLNLRLGNDDGIIAELQLHLDSYLKIKNDRGHVNYEAARSIHMFNNAFTTRSFLWESDTDESEVEAFLEKVRSGIISNLTLDYSTGLWSVENKKRLQKALQDDRNSCKTISLRSCKCGDDFILMSINDAFYASKQNDAPPVVSTLRLGSVVHDGAAGRISSEGVLALLGYLNDSLRYLDLEGCLDMEYFENCGDEIAKAFVTHVDKFIENGKQPLPQFQELNLNSTGLTEEGLSILLSLKENGKVPRLAIRHDDDLNKPAQPVGPHRRPAVVKEESAFLRQSQIP